MYSLKLFVSKPSASLVIVCKWEPKNRCHLNHFDELRLSAGVGRRTLCQASCQQAHLAYYSPFQLKCHLPQYRHRSVTEWPSRGLRLRCQRVRVGLSSFWAHVSPVVLLLSQDWLPAQVEFGWSGWITVPVFLRVVLHGFSCCGETEVSKQGAWPSTHSQPRRPRQTKHKCGNNDNSNNKCM